MFGLNDSVAARPAPVWHVAQWFNARQDLTLEKLSGKVVALFAFQMLCPGCVANSIPQALELSRAFRSEDVAVIGFHTVFEHHAAMMPIALRAFLHEYRVGFPVAADEAGDNRSPLPKTMAAYEMQGTPTLVLIDRHGLRRFQTLGHVPDLQLGASIASLLAEGGGIRHAQTGSSLSHPSFAPENARCIEGTCEAEA